MKIVEPSADIIENELSELSVYQRIDYCSSVCYQRQIKATDEEAKEAAIDCMVKNDCDRWNVI